jgi:tetratricopeptide (TPR) repeat protein
MLDARAGDVVGALAGLNRLIDEFDRKDTSAVPDRASVNTVLTRRPVEATLGIPLDETLLEAHHLLSLLGNNRDPLYGYQPVIEMLRFYPRAVHYRDNLRRLADRYPAAQIADNVELEIALATPQLDERIALLQACLEHHPAGDARPEALFKLGGALCEAAQPAEARQHYERILQDYPDSIWRQQAEERLRVLPPVPAATDTG